MHKTVVRTDLPPRGEKQNRRKKPKGRYKMVKADKELGIIKMFLTVSTKDGEPYFDRHNDHIPDELGEKACLLAHSPAFRKRYLAENPDVDPAWIKAMPLPMHPEHDHSDIMGETAIAIQLSEGDIKSMHEEGMGGTFVVFVPKPERFDEALETAEGGSSVGGIWY